MQEIIQLRAVTHHGDIEAQDVIIEQCGSAAGHPRLSFAQRFLQQILSDHYPLLQAGNEYKETTLNFTFRLQHVHITLAEEFRGEKRVVVTGLLLD